ncbi:hypothetical protein ACKWTF_008984 [Chironomus riparius]
MSSKKIISKDKVIKLEDFFEVQLKLFKLVGLDMFPKIPITKREIVVQKLMKIYFYICILGFMILSFQFGIHILKNITKFQTVVLTLPYLIIFPYNCAKSILFFTKRKKILQILEKLKISFPTTKADQLSCDLDSPFKWFHIFSKVFVFISFFAVSMILINALFFFFFFKVRKLETEVWFPFDHLATDLNFLCALSWAIWTAYNSIYILCAVDTFLCCTFLILSIEFRIIGQGLKNAINAKELDKLRAIVVRHQELIVIDEEIKKIFSPIFFFAFILGSITISSSIFLISTTSSTSSLMSASLNALSSIINVFVNCYFGEKLITESESIAISIYDSDWYEIDDKEAKRLIQLVLMRSQKACTLSGYGFVTLSIDSFAIVLKSAYSFMTVLQNLFLK